MPAEVKSFMIQVNIEKLNLMAGRQGQYGYLLTLNRNKEKQNDGISKI